MTYNEWEVLAKHAVPTIQDAEARGDTEEANRIRTCIWDLYRQIEK